METPHCHGKSITDPRHNPGGTEIMVASVGSSSLQTLPFVRREVHSLGLQFERLEFMPAHIQILFGKLAGFPHFSVPMMNPASTQSA